MPEIDTKTCNQLLLHQFLAGLPFMASKQLCMWQRGNKWAQRNTHVSYLLFKDQQQPPASGHWDHSTYQPRWKLEQVMTANLARLNDQVVALSEQVEASCRQGESNSRPAVRRNFHGFHGFQFQSTCTHCKILLPGKLQWGACETQSTWENPWFCDSERFNTNGQIFLQFHGLMLRLHYNSGDCCPFKQTMIHTTIESYMESRVSLQTEVSKYEPLVVWAISGVSHSLLHWPSPCLELHPM